MKFRLAVIHFGFALTGVVTTMLGPILPLLSSQWSLSYAQSGRLFTVQFLLSVTGALIASRVMASLGAARTVVIGMVLIALGVGTMALGNLPAVIVGIGVYGAGLGFALPCTNLMVSEMVENRAAALNLLNFSWTVGALAAPMLIDSLLKPIGLRGFLVGLAALCFAVGMVEIGGVRQLGAIEKIAVVGKLGDKARITFAVLTAVLLFLYVGVENGVAGWVPTFAQRVEYATSRDAALVQSSFWAAILLGRLTAPLVLRIVRPAKLVFLGLFLATVGSALIVFAHDLPLFVIGVLASGIGLSSVFPNVIAIFTEWYGTGGAGSIVLGVPGLGGALFPWLVGVVGEKTGHLRLGMSVNIAVAAAALMVFFAMIQVALGARATALEERSA
ncbi:MAG TPA: MFS transporter [Terriglobales bacterium]|nr:MFS transporter [Terriglobales bacterium]